MRDHSVLMLPGVWESEEQSFELAQAVQAFSGEMPIDIAKRVRTTGFVLQGVSAEGAGRCVEAVARAGHIAVAVREPAAPWEYPEVRTASHVSFEGTGLTYKAGMHEGALAPVKLLFIHLAWFKRRGTRGSGSLLAGRAEEIAQSLRIDLHCATPRMILRLDVDNTRYRFPEGGEAEWQLVGASRVLRGLVPLGMGKLIVPDGRLLTTPIENELWARAELPDEASVRSQGSWFLRLAESGHLEETIAQVRHRQLEAVVDSLSIREELEHSAPVGPLNPYQEQLDTVEKWLHRKLPRRAMKAAEKAIELRPERPEGYRSRAKVHLAMDNPTKADDDMATADRLEAER